MKGFAAGVTLGVIALGMSACVSAERDEDCEYDSSSFNIADLFTDDLIVKNPYPVVTEVGHPVNNWMDYLQEVNTAR